MRFFRLLLHLYPASFRSEYEDELAEVFARRLRDASWWGSRLGVALDAFVDTVSNAAAVHCDILWQDVRFAMRVLVRAPGFTSTAIVVSALGIGASTAAFTVTDHVLIRPLPFRDPARLVKVWEDQSPNGPPELEPSPANYRDWKRTNHTFDELAAYSGLAANIRGNGEPERLEGALVTAGLFPMLGVRPAFGRIFSEEDDRPEAPATLLLSTGLWKRRFGADPGILGRKVILDDLPYVVIGVMREDLHFPYRGTQFWVPARFNEAAYADRSDNYLNVIGRLRPGMSIAQSQSEMQVVARQLEQTYPKENLHLKIAVESMRDDVSKKSRMLLMAMLGAAFCVLLIACANLANLLLARALSRRKELAVRTALGVGRERMVRQLLTESCILAFAGGSLGVLLAFSALPLLARLVPNGLPIAEVPAVDLRVLGFAAGIALLTGIGFGVLPSLRACGSVDFAGLREGSRGGVGGRKERLRTALVTAEVAGSVVLLVSAGLLIRALWHIETTDPGFRAAGVLTMRTVLPVPKYASGARRNQFYSQVLAEAKALPGVSGAAYASFLPIVFGGGIWHVTAEGGPPENVTPRDTSLRFITPGYFAAMGIPLRLGRDVAESDQPESNKVAVVSESFVRRYWPGQNPIGRHFSIANAVREVVAVAGDVKVRGLERFSEPQVYLPYRQRPDNALAFYAPNELVVRSTADPSVLVSPLRQIIGKADPEQPISAVRTLSEIVEMDTASRAVQVRVLGAFAAIAFLLAGIGLYGLLSYAVFSRSQEFGVRMALGAQRRRIVAMVVRDGARLALAGVIPGVCLAYVAARSMSALLADVNPADGATFASAVTLCLVMTLAGSLLPAVRAVRLDPTRVMRSE
ncbi:MAG TPA: ABC transporter permease [Bryobacteraceae bacterium]|nr:ABC transporter permease [Bryobacteraceae bacterium]